MGAVVAGTIVSLAVTAVLLLVGGGLQASTGVLDFPNLVGEATLAGSWILGSAAIGAFLGGKMAAVSSRALVRRDGALGGLVTGSLITLLTMAGAWFAASFWPADRPADFLWALISLDVTILVAATVGGARGARSEARAIGLRSVRAPDDSDIYERDFFGGASLSSNATSGNNWGIP